MLTPEDIENRDFLVSLRGFDRGEVRAFLADVADQLRALETAVPAEREEDEPAADPSGAFAEIGQQTQRILEAARDAAEDIAAKARADAEREVAAAREEAARIVAAGEGRRAEIEAVVADLRARRDELVASLRDVGRSIERMVGGLTGPETTPAGAQEAGTREAGTREAGTREAGTREAGTREAGTREAGTREAGTREAGTGEAGTREAGTSAAGRALQAGAPDARPAPGAAGEAAEAHTPPAGGPPGGAVTPVTEQAPVAPLGGEMALPDPRVARAEALEPLQAGLVRSLVGGLAGLHALVVERLRLDGDRMPPTNEELSARLADVAREPLAAAYRAGRGTGARLAGSAEPAGDERSDLAAGLAADAAEQLQRRLADALADDGQDTDTTADRVGAVLSELELAEELAASHLVRAYELGQLDAWTAAGVTHRRWVVGREPRCPEARCRVNEEAGAVAVGTAFRSGDDSPPAHVGCTCTTTPALLSEPRS